MKNNALENFTWSFFQTTGSIETFLEYTKIRNLHEDDKGNENLGNDN